MVCAIEDAGFEIRDCIQWIYGSGFPKSHDISKAIDKKLGTCPQAPEAQKWEGWGTALKPANEPIVLARKPISEKTIAENVMKWGTGGLNIDGCRIGTDIVGWGGRPSSGYSGGLDTDTSGKPRPVVGRFPANVILDEEAGRMLDEQSGITKSGKVKTDKEAYEGTSNTGFLRGKSTSQNQHGDTGGASRFFYCAKASKKERNMGLEDVEPTTVDDGRNKPIDNPFLRGKTLRQNTHPTVKPVKLMEYLITLVTPPNGIVLDPFFGSGTTGIAAVNLGFNYIGIELDEQYVEIARRRINAAREQFHKHKEVAK
jgi:site-specific DNA-methyltransferase (adenine-specific)